MSQSQPSLTASIRAVARNETPEVLEHPDPELLLAYHARELSEQERDRLQEHLVACSECARAVIDLARFPDIEAAHLENRISDQVMSRELQRLRERIVEENADLEGPRSPWPPPASQVQPPSRRSWQLQSLAAMLALASLGLLVRLYVVEGRIDSLQLPHGESSEARLESELGKRGEIPESVVIAEKRAPLVIYLEGYDLERYDAYEAKFTLADGSPFLAPISLAPRGSGPLTIWFPVPPAEGSYRIELTGYRAGRPEPLRTYRLRIAHE